MNLFKYLWVVLALLIWTGCNKDENGNLKIAGKVTDPKVIGGGEISGLTLTLLNNKLQGGTFSNTFDEIMSVTTDANGNYSFEFERENTIDYKIKGQREDYFPIDIIISPDNVDPGVTYTQNIQILPEAEISVRIFNETPESEEDKCTFQFLTAGFPCDCCTGDQTEYVVMDIDSTSTCLLEGNSWIKYYYIVDKPSVFYSILDSVYCDSFQTTDLEIAY